MGDGIYQVTVIADDGNGGTVSNIVRWTITNPPPVAANDTATTDEDVAVNIDVLANDTDPDGDTLSLASATALNGSAVIEADGTITYTPAQDFNGTDTITYQISDGEGGVDTATVTVTINPVNDDPTVSAQILNQDNSDADVVALDVSGNFEDLDGDTLIFGATGLPPGLSIDAAGKITGTVDPSASQGGPAGNGVYQITVTAGDGNGGTVSSTFFWTIDNPAPTAANDTASIVEDNTVIIDVLANDGDPDGDALTVISANANNGSVFIEADGTLTYTPDANFNGTDTITYLISDGEGGTSTAFVTVTVSAVNDAPETDGLPNLTDGNNEMINVPLGAAFFDPEGDAISYIITGLPDGLTFDSATGTVSGTTTATASTGGPGGDGIYTVTVTANDGNGGVASTSFTWTINNQPPTAVNDSFTGTEDSPQILDVLANDIDPDGDPITPIVITSAIATNGTALVNPDGTILFTPDPNFNGVATVTYTIEDANGDPATAVATINIAAVNDAPEVTPLPDRADQDGDTITIDASSLFTDVEGDTLTYSVANLPAGLSINPTTGLITGTIDSSASQFNGGVYSSVITADDGNGGVTDVMFVWTVTNPGPTAVDDTASTTEDAASAPIDVLANDIDPDNDTLTVISANAPNGTVVINPDNTLTYTPDANFNGTDTITYQISDGEGGISTAMVSLNVIADNDDPTAQPLPARGSLDAEVVNLDLSGGFDDLDNDTLTFSATGLPTGLSIDANGVVIGTIDRSASQGGPAGDGVYSVTVTANDGNGGTVSTSFTWTVTNPAPTAVNDTATTNEDAPVNTDVLANDNDPDGDGLAVTLASAANGTIVIEADGTLTYTPDTDFTGTDTITYEISDGEGGTSTATLTVTVNAQNDDPTATPVPPRADVDGAMVSVSIASNFDDVEGDTLTFSATGLPTGLLIDAAGSITGTIDAAASQGGPLNDGFYSVTITADDGNGGSVSTTFDWTVTNPVPVAADDSATTDEDTTVNIDVLANDNDPDGDPLTVVTATAGNGTVTIRSDGTIDYTPVGDFIGTDTILYTISDGNGGTASASVTVAVNPGNDDPIAADDTATTDEDTSVTIAPLANDSDVDGDPLTITSATAPNGNVTINRDGTVTYTPNRDFNGTDTITYGLSDGNGGTDIATIAVLVAPMNDDPVAVPDTVTTPEDTPIRIPVLTNDTDVDGDPLIIAAATSPNGTVTINPDGTITFVPNPDFNGPTAINYAISDGMGGTATATVTVNVNPVNDPPVGQLDTATTDEDTPVTIPVLANDSDLDGDPLTVVSASAPNGTVTINPDGTVTYTPEPNFSGTDTITYQVSDGMGGFDTATATITVNPVNDAPIAGADVATVDEDSQVTISILANDSDPDGDPITVTDASAPNGTVTINPDGTVTYSPNPDFFGTDTITYRVSDGNGGIATGTVDVTVNNVNDLPADEPEAVDAFSGAPTIIDVLENASDPDGDPLSVIMASVDIGKVFINSDGTLSYTPPDGFTGLATILYTISDGNGGFVNSTAIVDVSAAGADVRFLLRGDLGTGPLDFRAVEEVLDQSSSFVTTPLIILDAVNGFRPLSGFGALSVEQPLLEAVNVIRSLDGVGDFDRSGRPIDSVMRQIDQVRDLRFGADRLFDPRFADLIPQSLTGFSLRQLDAGNDRVMIDSIVRARVVYIEMRDIGESASSPIAEFQLLTRDGSPLPDWIRIDPRGLAIIERPVDFEELRLIVRAITEDIETIDIPIRIQGATGEIQADVPFDRSLIRTETLSEMMTRESSGTSDEVENLLAAFL
ncbi:Ig-like domain-containing protein [Erythrobacter ani]|uniref:Tandem-95 repeat protein n=1 Tax=Erythrobacter ani TaxID=2827235 RepID=A0ABS6SLL7_9SPHN|nr:Ig-like domain-containing protein [Erythrobacter ani]MBV7265915.1 tandem-95 repeat protein [Erythrobacter ani]